MNLRSIQFELLAILAGAIFPFALAPFYYWPLAFVSAALLYCATLTGSRGRSMLRFYLYNLAMFVVGVSWIFVSINQYGGASPLLAGFLVGLFVAAYSLISLPQGYIYAKWLRSARGPLLALTFAALWVLQEWFRSWFLTGFPWLFQGYAVLDTPLVGLAPYAGIFGVSFTVVLVACLLADALLNLKRIRAVAISGGTAVAMILITLGANQYDQTERSGRLEVALVQGNIDQHVKWRRESVQPILRTYFSLTEAHYDADLIVWPEAAITVFHDNAENILATLADRVSAGDGALVLGIPDRSDTGSFQNTVVSIGEGGGQYIKRRLVPFGEYVPLESILRGAITFFDLPMSRNRPGPADQAPLTAGDITLSTSICYEVVYPDLVRSTVNDPDLLVTISNDTWFGTSIGPWQHLQMAQMRALENGRSMVRATNNGVTGFISHRGELLDSLPQFEAGTLRGEVDLRTGTTLFHRLGSYPLLLLSLFMLFYTAFRRQRSSP